MSDAPARGHAQAQEPAKTDARDRTQETGLQEEVGLATESMMMGFLLDDRPSDTALERHVSLLSDPRLSLSPNAIQRAALTEQLQRRYGNGYVNQVVSLARERNAVPQIGGAPGLIIQRDLEDELSAPMPAPSSPDRRRAIQERRERMRAYVRSLDPEEARGLLRRLQRRRPGDRLSELFYDRLHGAVRRELLRILRSASGPAAPETGAREGREPEAREGGEEREEGGEETTEEAEGEEAEEEESPVAQAWRPVQFRIDSVDRAAIGNFEYQTVSFHALHPVVRRMPDLTNTGRSTVLHLSAPARVGWAFFHLHLTYDLFSIVSARVQMGSGRGFDEPSEGGNVSFSAQDITNRGDTHISVLLSFGGEMRKQGAAAPTKCRFTGSVVVKGSGDVEARDARLTMPGGAAIRPWPAGTGYEIGWDLI